MLDRYCVGLNTPPDVAASPTGCYYVYNILKLFVPLSQRNESCEVIEHLKYVLDVDILTLMTENLLEVVCCGTALCFS